MGHESREAGSDNEYNEWQQRTKTQKNKKNSNKIRPDEGLQFDNRKKRNN